jgi:hypothetical protein
MSTDEVDAIFQTHADFVNSLRCLSLSPVVQNIDRVGTEYCTEGNILRTARLWAKTLLNNEGNSLRCDAENGGDNQRTHLLVPAENLNRARQALAIYKESISPFSLRENHFAERIAQAHPAEIYVPTAAANHNLDLIKDSVQLQRGKMHLHPFGNLQTTHHQHQHIDLQVWNSRPNDIRTRRKECSPI